MSTWGIQVSESPYIFHMEKFEDIVNAKAYLHVWLLGIHQETGWLSIARWEHKQIFVPWQVGVVLVGQGAPHRTYAEHLPPLQVFDKWDAVELAYERDDHSLSGVVRHASLA